MISAKDEFFIDREIIQELNNTLSDCGIWGEEREQIISRVNNCDDFKREIFQLQSNQTYLNKIKNGEWLREGEKNKAVDKAVNNE